MTLQVAQSSTPVKQFGGGVKVVVSGPRFVRDQMLVDELAGGVEVDGVLEAIRRDVETKRAMNADV